MLPKMLILVTLMLLPVVSNADDPYYVYPDVFNDPERDAFLFGTFPEGFIWSSATSSYQIEGGYDADGKGYNIWDTFANTPGNIANNDTGNIACDSYNKWEEDVRIIKELDLEYYRFSLSWSRILPDGTADNVNQAGIDYYNNLIDGLLADGITPMVTLYHWDLPQDLQDDYGGWLNETIIYDFGEYARVCYENFGDRVKLWLTLNEPWIIAQLGYGCGGFAPGVCADGTGSYVAAHNLIKSHAKAWHIYDEDFRATQAGRVGITLNSDWMEPYNRSLETDLNAAERAQQFHLGWFGHPIFVDGDYPEVMREMIDYSSEVQGYNESRLPTFTALEKEYILGSSDFFGLNHYTTGYASKPDEWVISDNPSYYNDYAVDFWKDPEWPSSGSDWLKSVPWGIRRLLEWIKDEYGDPEIYVTENGFSTKDIDDLNDPDRIDYYQSYIDEVLKAIEMDGVNVKAYTAWSLMDNFEWAAGYTERFGMHHVDFDDDDRPRTQKDSSLFYATVKANNGFPKPTEEPITEEPAVAGSSHLGLTITCFLPFVNFCLRKFIL